MKNLIYFIFFLILSSCSFNSDSEYWTEDVIKKKSTKKQLDKIIKKSKDITQMSIYEYKIYIEDHTEKSKYPNINK